MSPSTENRRDIEELDDTAQLVRVSWRKANNYFVSLARTVIETKAKLDSGVYGPEWTFQSWMIRKAGMYEDQMMRRLTLFFNVIAAEEREVIEKENNRIKNEKRDAAEKEKAEKAAAKAVKAQERERERQEKQRLQKENLQEKQRLEAEKEREREALRATQEAQRKQREAEQKAAQRAKKKAADKAKPLPKDGPSPEANQLLAECAAIEKTSRIELGKRYVALKKRVDNHLEGKDSDGKWWKWTNWAPAYIQGRGLRSIEMYMKAFRDSELF